MRDVELYYSEDINAESNSIILDEEESKHVKKVMRHSVNDVIYVTDGQGKIYESQITDVEGKLVVCEILKTQFYQNHLENFVFSFPRLKNNDRFEFALEKSIELGITNFIIFESQRTIPKGSKLERWEKIALSAMKQSLRCIYPRIFYLTSTNKLAKQNGRKLIIEQQGSRKLEDIDFTKAFTDSEKVILIFGPEGGLNDTEIEMLSREKSDIYKIHENRLRSETAITYTASIITSQFRV